MKTIPDSGLSAAAPLLPQTMAATPPAPIAVLAADATLASYLPGDDCGSDPVEFPGPCEAMASSCGDSEGHVSGMACPSQLPLEGCADLLHELSNLITGVLLNAQMLEWKLPPYSHLKRPVREVARNAQRGSELMKRLQRRCADAGQRAQASGESQAAGAGHGTKLSWPGTGPASTADDGVEGALPQQVFDLTRSCDPRTGDVFPKRDDGCGH